jgi:putative copper resistance protein D
VIWLLEGISGFAWFWFVSAQMSDESPWSLLASDDLTTVLWQTQFGQLWLMRAIVGIALGFAFHLMSRRKVVQSLKPSFLDWLSLVISSVLLVSLAWAGHATSGIRFHALHLIADALHLLIGAVWPVGLVPLFCFLRHIYRGDIIVPVDHEIRILQGFSQISLMAVLSIVATGTINGWLMVGSWGALVTTPYGRLLLGKILIVGMMVFLGAVNRFLILPRLKTGPALFQTLRRMILVESGLALIVLLIVGVMGTTAPPS